jgi:hypothetical protein
MMRQSLLSTMILDKPENVASDLKETNLEIVVEPGTQRTEI